jgi:hypothetical protein
MSRILGILVLILAAVLLLPSVRERAQPQIEWALTPVYRWEAKNRVNDIHRVLQRERAVGTPLPRERDFRRFLEQREGPDAALDPWGEPFFLEVDRTSFRVGSSGQDRTRGTRTDIHSKPVEVAGTR